MVRREEILDDDNSVNSVSTTESSDSYSYLLRDLENPDNHINEEWEAIERTLYQESGKQVTDPILAKECKLWRDTFPHIRVRGTALKVQPDEPIGLKSTKSVQSVDNNHAELSRLNEKREKIKKAVVSQIVERLIHKLNVNKENDLVNEKIMDSKEDKKENANVKCSETQSEKESYFERGKTGENKRNTSPIPADEYPSPVKNTFIGKNCISDDFECNFSTDYLKTGSGVGLWSGYPCNEKSNREKGSASNLARNEEILRSGRVTFKIAEKKSSIRPSREKASDSLAAITKPFEPTKKIDKKYESMLERILENKGFVATDSGKSSKLEISSYRESMENFTGKRSRDCVKNKRFPKLNNFTNNWMNRSHRLPLPSCDPYAMLSPANEIDSIGIETNVERQTVIHSFRSANNNLHRYNNFFDEIGREMFDFAPSSRRNYEEETKLLHCRGCNRSGNARTHKSSSCSDIPKKNLKSCNKTLKSSLEKGKSELTVRNGAKKKTEKITGNQNVQLPPIETSIVCTEIIGRPKVTSKSLPKKYI